ncbi:MAG: 2-C-methyl-D-erythritol 4-phosphate cytidylyltransferase [Elusimicrobia bacterium]|nr:2-C-methyl-D-erythritol 4-phosphate cytidylyltransferase [Candidatus Liberimonas magnetica]
MKAAVIIAAAGLSKRFGSKKPKQFLLLNKLPVFLWSVIAFLKIKEVKQIILVVPQDAVRILKKHEKKYGFTLIAGGKERFDSVKNGLKALNRNIDIVAIHDGARPLISTDTIRNCLNAAKKYGAAIAALDITDTVKLCDKSLAVKKTISRDLVWRAQTPQVFKREVIERAYSRLNSKNVTDDSQIVESSGYRVKIVKDRPSNIKITKPKDLLLCKLFVGNNLL